MDVETRNHQGHRPVSAFAPGCGFGLGAGFIFRQRSSSRYGSSSSSHSHFQHINSKRCRCPHPALTINHMNSEDYRDANSSNSELDASESSSEEDPSSLFANCSNSSVDDMPDESIFDVENLNMLKKRMEQVSKSPIPQDTSPSSGTYVMSKDASVEVMLEKCTQPPSKYIWLFRGMGNDNAKGFLSLEMGSSPTDRPMILAFEDEKDALQFLQTLDDDEERDDKEEYSDDDSDYEEEEDDGDDEYCDDESDNDGDDGDDDEYASGYAPLDGNALLNRFVNEKDESEWLLVQIKTDEVSEFCATEGFQLGIIPAGGIGEDLDSAAAMFEGEDDDDDGSDLTYEKVFESQKELRATNPDAIKKAKELNQIFKQPVTELPSGIHPDELIQ